MPSSLELHNKNRKVGRIHDVGTTVCMGAVYPVKDSFFFFFSFFRDIPTSFTDWSPSDPSTKVSECLGSDVFPNMWRWKDISWFRLSFYFFLFMQLFSYIFFRFYSTFFLLFSHLLPFGFLSSSQSFLSSVKFPPLCFSAKDVEVRSNYTYKCSSRIQGVEGPKPVQCLCCGLEPGGMCGSWFEASCDLLENCDSRVVIPYRRFGKTSHYHLQGSRIPTWDLLVFLSHEYRTDRLSRNVGTKLPIYTA